MTRKQKQIRIHELNKRIVDLSLEMSELTRSREIINREMKRVLKEKHKLEDEISEL